MANANLANPFASCSMKLKRAHYNLTVGIGPSSMCMRRIRRPSCRRNVLPHGKDAAHFEKNLEKQCRRVPQHFVQIIRECEPYCGGKGYLIRALHELNIVDKKRPLIQQNFAMQEVHIDQQIRSTPKVLSSFRPCIGAAKRPRKMKTPAKTQKTQCVLAVRSFGEVEVLRSRPVRVVMEEMAACVQQIIEKLGKSALSQP